MNSKQQGSFTIRLGSLGLIFIASFSSPVQSATTEVTEILKEVIVTGRTDDLTGYATTSSQGAYGYKELSDRPILRRGEILEAVPGVVITQHSGGGKANQYFLRGFNLDHGTDFALSLEGVPINNRTHGHGQGYADTNFIIPEFIERLDYNKGPFFAEVGDFSAAGSSEFQLFKKLPENFATFTYGDNEYYRAVVGQTVAVGRGSLTYGLEFTSYEGPFALAEGFQRYNGLVRYHWADADAEFILTGLAYHACWDSNDQVAQRAIDSGLIDRLGYIDGTVGGNSNRYSVMAEGSSEVGEGRLRANAYATEYDLNLFSNFTYFLDDPVNGDQFQQIDRRYRVGTNLDYTLPSEWFGKEVTNTLGLQIQNDIIPTVGLYRTVGRARLSTTRQDEVLESSVALFGKNEIKWTDWFRSILGVRADVFYFDVNNTSGLPENSGKVIDGLASPKVSFILGPWEKTELYLNMGFGFHSNDARGVTIQTDPVTGTPSAPAPGLVRSRSIEVGARTSWIENLVSTASLFYLENASEIVFTGDAGNTEPSGATSRVGVELANFYKPFTWLTLDADLSMTKARYLDTLLSGGDRVPGSIDTVFAAGITAVAPNGIYGTLRSRYFAPRPLIEDNTVVGKSSFSFNLRAGWRFHKAWEASIDVLNLFDAHDNDIEYFYTSRLPGEVAGGVDDVHIHPLEPRTVRASVTWRF